MQQRLIANLSKGYQQRVGIAQAIIHKPVVIVLDEPTVGLDPIQIQEIRRLIKELAQDHSVILSTHILQEVEVVCDRVHIINHGQTVFADTLDALQNYQNNELGADASLENIFTALVSS
jgi:ABC-2 type transport system ATP-binding protein